MPSTVGASEEATSTMTPMPPRIDRHIPDLVTLEEAGEIIGRIDDKGNRVKMSRQGIHKMIQAGRLPAKRVGGTWFVRRVIAERFATPEPKPDAARDSSSTEEESRG